jgi:hypothetical protein
MWLTLGLGIWPGGCSSWTIENGLRGETEPPPGSVASDPLSLPGAASVPVRGCATCDPEHPAWDARTEWRAEHPAGAGHAGTPVVAHLDDDDGDGVIGSRGDRPEILVPTSDAGGMRIEAVRGDGTPFRIYDRALHEGLQEIAVADLDRDGRPEIVAVAEVADRAVVVALSVDGRTIWQSENVFSGVGDPSGTACLPVVADLEGDGRTEVLCDAVVLDGATGATLWRRPEDGLRWGTATVGDLDLDGRSEVVFADGVYRSDGTPWWAIEPGEGSVFPAVAELDGDPEGELLFADQGALAAYDTDGTPLWRQQVEISGQSRPCLADFDGDG